MAGAGEGFGPLEDIFVGLGGEFAGGTEDDADGTFAADEGELGFFFEGEHYDGETEGESFTRAGEGNADHVAAGQTEETVEGQRWEVGSQNGGGRAYATGRPWI